MTLEEALATIEAILGEEPLNDIQKTVISQSWEQKTYSEIAESYDYDDGYVKYVGFQLWKMLSVVLGEKVTKNNFRLVLSRWRSSQSNNVSAKQFITSQQKSDSEGELLSSLKNESGSSSQEDSPVTNQTNGAHSGCRLDWGKAIDVSVFYGRSQELAILEQWIVREHCRLVALLGIGGIGKTALSVKLAEQLQEQFDYVIWRSLHNAPSIELLLADLILVLSDQQKFNLPETVSQKISKLLEFLQKHRCLIILDNVETILCSTDTSGSSYNNLGGYYRAGYEAYGDLFWQVGELRSNSCLVLTSREKPKEVAILEGKTLPVRSLHLFGLTIAAAQQIFTTKGEFSGSPEDWKTLIQSYGGNPLALKIVASTIHDLFNGNIVNFLSWGTVIFGDILKMLNQQFNRLSNLEKELMYWLAINREPITLAELASDLLSAVLPSRLLEALESLERRCYLERALLSLPNQNITLFTLQPVVMEYLTMTLVEQVCSEIESQEIFLFKKYALTKAQAKEYVRDIQIEFILKAVIKQLLQIFGEPEKIKIQLMQILRSLQDKALAETGYAGGNTINLLRELKIDLSGHDFSKLVIWQANLKDINLNQTNFSNSDLSKCAFTENLSYVFSLAMSPDGKLLATGDSHGTITLWQIVDGQQRLAWEGHKGWIRSVSFSADGQTLISGGEDQVIKLWDVSNGHCRQTFKGHTRAVWSVAIARQPDSNISYSQILVSGSADQTVKLWDVNTGQCLRTFHGHTSWIWSVTLNPNGTYLASGSDDQTVKLWDVNTGQCLKTFNGHKNKVWSVKFSADGKTLVSASADRTVKLWEVETGQNIKTLQGHMGCVWCVDCSSDRKTLASSSNDKTIKLWDINTGQCFKTLQGHTNGIRSLVFSSDGQILSSSDEDQTVKLWDVRTGDCLRTFRGYGNGVWGIALSPQDNPHTSSRATLASGGEDQTVKLWNISTGECMKTLKGHTNRVLSVTYSPNCQTLASGSADQMVKIWDIKTGKSIQSLKGHTDWVLSVAYSPDGHFLASSSTDQTIRVWNVSTGQCFKTFKGHESAVCSVAYSPVEQILASGGADQAIRIWDVNTGECFRIFKGHTNWVYSVNFSPDGQTLASGSEDKMVKIWDTKTGHCLKTFQGHTKSVISVMHSPNGQFLASAGRDQTVRIWDINTSQCLKVLEGHNSCIYAIAFSHFRQECLTNTPQVLISSSEDQTIRLWDIETGECLKILRSKRLYEGMNITCVVGLTEAQKITLKALGAVTQTTICPDLEA
ncbi:NB-ARC domain-containing protein [Scytonema sp. NUACC21]